MVLDFVRFSKRTAKKSIKEEVKYDSKSKHLNKETICIFFLKHLLNMQCSWNIENTKQRSLIQEVYSNNKDNPLSFQKLFNPL